MADNVQKIPFASSIQRFVETLILDHLQLKGQSLPCSVVAVSNSIVTVKFEVVSKISFPIVQVPQAISRYARPPTQIGDKGFVVAADVYLGGMSGLGGGVATYGEIQPNLTTLVFVPLSSTDTTKFPVLADPNAYHITGPNGAVIQDDGANSVVTISSTGITLAFGSNTLTINSSGITMTGTVTIDGRTFLTHEHSGVQAGGSNTGGVV